MVGEGIGLGVRMGHASKGKFVVCQLSGARVRVMDELVGLGDRGGLRRWLYGLVRSLWCAGFWLVVEDGGFSDERRVLGGRLLAMGSRYVESCSLVNGLGGSMISNVFLGDDPGGLPKRCLFVLLELYL